MNIEKYMFSNNLSPADVVELLKPDFPKFDKRQVSMCKNGEYGVTLSPMAVKTLNAVHPVRKENRKKGNRITVRLTDVEYAALLSFVEMTNSTVQDEAEKAVRWFLSSMKML
jgi:hypothetical protein